MAACVAAIDGLEHCTTAWDEDCVEAAGSECGAQCPICGDGTCNPGFGEKCNSCPGDCGAYPDCGDNICGVDENCGSCPGDCGSCAGECCTANGTIGCDQDDVTASVCAADPLCCELEWENLCAQAAVDTGAICQSAPACTSGMVNTTVVDGPLLGGNPKGVELFVCADIPDLSLYGLGSATNGGGTDGQEFTFPEVSASAGTYLGVTSEQKEFANFFDCAPNYTTGVMLINGDDVVELFGGGVPIDTFGDINQDGSGQPWDYLDSFAQRADGVVPNGGTFLAQQFSYAGPNFLDGKTSASEVGPTVGTWSNCIQ